MDELTSENPVMQRFGREHVITLARPDEDSIRFELPRENCLITRGDRFSILDGTEETTYDATEVSGAARPAGFLGLPSVVLIRGSRVR